MEGPGFTGASIHPGNFLHYPRFKWSRSPWEMQGQCRAASQMGMVNSPSPEPAEPRDAKCFIPASKPVYCWALCCPYPAPVLVTHYWTLREALCPEPPLSGRSKISFLWVIWGKNYCESLDRYLKASMSPKLFQGSPCILAFYSSSKKDAPVI